MKYVVAVLVAAVACGCHDRPPAVKALPDVSLAGVVVRKEWTKSQESWDAGGSEYYVLKVADSAVPPDQQSAGEGVILRPSATVPFGKLADFVGKAVTCRGEFVVGEPYTPPKDGVEQVPELPDPATGETKPPTRGLGFRVHAIESVHEK